MRTKRQSPYGRQLSQWLERELVRQRLSRRELSRRSGLSSSLITKIIRHHHVPESPTLFKIADALGRSRETLLEVSGMIEMKMPEEADPRMRDILRRLANLPGQDRDFALSLLEDVVKRLERNGA